MEGIEIGIPMFTRVWDSWAATSIWASLWS